MAQSSSNTAKKVIKIDVSSDSVCPWCFVGKKNLDKALALSKDQYDFEIKWHPYLLNPSAPIEGINKKEYYKTKFGSRADQMHGRMAEVFKGLGLNYDLDGLVFKGPHSRLNYDLVGLTPGDVTNRMTKRIIFISWNSPANESWIRTGKLRILMFQKMEFWRLTRWVLLQINGKHQLSGGQPAEVFLRAFQVAAK
ncbi:DSBA oxidoreductase family protein isoform 2 [Tanacetum coccineum]